jgi:hypothetical protein
MNVISWSKTEVHLGSCHEDYVMPILVRADSGHKAANFHTALGMWIFSLHGGCNLTPPLVHAVRCRALCYQMHSIRLYKHRPHRNICRYEGHLQQEKTGLPRLHHYNLAILELRASTKKDNRPEPRIERGTSRNNAQVLNTLSANHTTRPPGLLL